MHFIISMIIAFVNMIINHLIEHCFGESVPEWVGTTVSFKAFPLHLGSLLSMVLQLGL